MEQCHGITQKNTRCKNKTNCQHHTQANIEGEGLKSFFKGIADRVQVAFQGPRKGATKRFDEFLNNEGTKEITNIQVARQPIKSVAKKLLDVISLGNFSKVAKRLNYEDIYHNYIIVTLADGKQYTVQKNEVVNEHQTTKADLQGERYNIPLNNKRLTLKEMINTASSQDPQKFYQYNPENTNCQSFVEEVIKKNGFSTPEEKANELILPQDAGKLISSLGVLSSIPKKVTDIAAVADRVIHGDGIIPRGFSHHSQLFAGMYHR